jgi:hypothetical protein
LIRADLLLEMGVAIGSSTPCVIGLATGIALETKVGFLGAIRSSGINSSLSVSIEF